MPPDGLQPWLDTQQGLGLQRITLHTEFGLYLHLPLVVEVERSHIESVRLAELLGFRKVNHPVSRHKQRQTPKATQRRSFWYDLGCRLPLSTESMECILLSWPSGPPLRPAG